MKTSLTQNRGGNAWLFPCLGLLLLFTAEVMAFAPKPFVDVSLVQRQLGAIEYSEQCRKIPPALIFPAVLLVLAYFLSRLKSKEREPTELERKRVEATLTRVMSGLSEPEQERVWDRAEEMIEEDKRRGEAERAGDSSSSSS